MNFEVRRSPYPSLERFSAWSTVFQIDELYVSPSHLGITHRFFIAVNRLVHEYDFLRGLEWLLTFMFVTAWVFEARHCPTLPNKIKKTKLEIYTSPQAGINILLAVRALLRKYS